MLYLLVDLNCLYIEAYVQISFIVSEDVLFRIVHSLIDCVLTTDKISYTCYVISDLNSSSSIPI